MKQILDDATAVYALRQLLPKLVAWVVGLTVCLALSLILALLLEGPWAYVFTAHVGASAALLLTYIFRIRRVSATLRAMEP